ncbi:MAG: phage portal protein [Aeromicrobium sp.]|uniref:phage portal protein n=1 Tax=Aeromicrobium sp. TaxID=1871063 RepID=UPI0039E345B6
MLRNWIAGRDTVATFADDPSAILPEALGGEVDVDPAVFGLASYTPQAVSTAPVTRREAMSVPAVKRGCDLIASTLGGLPIDLLGPGRKAVDWSLFDQPEAGTPRSVTFAKTFADLVLHARAWWRVTRFGWHTFPVEVKRIDPRRVALGLDGKVSVDGRTVPAEEMIRFDSPTEGLLVAGARAIRTCLNLDAAASRTADGTPPVDYFTPTDATTDATDADEVAAFLGSWEDARRARSTGWVPYALKYNVAGWSPDQLQLVEGRQHAVLEIARLMGVDPEELGVSTTSRTYANSEDRRKTFVDFTLGQFRQAFEDRLSMNDVTPRGYTARINLDAFLRGDTKSRYEAYEVAVRVGALTVPEIRELEDRPPLTPAELDALKPTAPPPAAPPAEPLAIEPPKASGDAAALTFTDETGVLGLDMGETAATFAVDREKRLIGGRLIPYGVVGVSKGQRWQFSQGSLVWDDPRRVKLCVGHDLATACGHAVELDDKPDGLYGTFAVERGPDGDRALTKAEDGVWDGLSVGVGVGGKYRTTGGVNHAVSMPLVETSLTPFPAFGDARVLAVAASVTEGDTMPTPEAQTSALDPTDGPDFSAIADAITAGFAGLSLPPREPVAPTVETTVDEAPLYRFDGLPAQRSVVADMRAALGGDAEARRCLDEHMAAAFAVTTANTATLNPVENRPDLYVGALHHNRPLWEMVTTGGVADQTPFTIPKFGSAAGLVNAHAEGVEPTTGSFTATSMTVSPKPKSGKVTVNREVIDQGGSPQADQIIWNEMMAAWHEAIENDIATTLGAVVGDTRPLGSLTGPALVAAVKRLMVGFQFVRGGNRFTGLALNSELFPELVDAKDSTGRPLLPVAGPTNADGGVPGSFDRVSIGSLTGRAAWPLGTSPSKLFVPSSVYAWASAPKRFDFSYMVKSVDIAIWGYAASAVTRDSDVVTLAYTAPDPEDG